jgi:hypothetical protein
MTAILTPALSLRHLRELSTDVRAAVALAPDGALLAGDVAIEAHARALLESLGEEDATALEGSGGTVVLARRGVGGLVVVAGPHALVELLRHDVRTLLADMHDGADTGSPPAPAAANDASHLPYDPATEGAGLPPAGVAAAVEALVRAAQRDFEG